MRIEALAQTQLLNLARRAIIDSLDAGRRLPVPEDATSGECSALLSEHLASFVTLSIAGTLRGCIGSIEASQALANDVWRNAQRAAFEDPRFPALRADETVNTTVEISVLSPQQRLDVNSEQELLAMLRPGIDGLLLICGARRATFLPAVWHKLPDAKVFVTQLKRKMGVADDFWDEQLVIKRYGAQEFGAMLLTEEPTP